MHSGSKPILNTTFSVNARPTHSANSWFSFFSFFRFGRRSDFLNKILVPPSFLLNWKWPHRWCVWFLFCSSVCIFLGQKGWAKLFCRHLWSVSNLPWNRSRGWFTLVVCDVAGRDPKWLKGTNLAASFTASARFLFFYLTYRSWSFCLVTFRGLPQSSFPALSL